jgi:Protein of unknown function (DUF429)
VHYCGVVPLQRDLQLAMLEEVRAPEPPIRLSAIFFEPGSAAQVAAELRSLGEIVVGVGAPLSGRHPELERRGVAPQPESPEAVRLAELLGLPVFTPEDDHDTDGPVPEGAYHDFPLFETNADGVFCALQGRRLPAKRHPYGMQLRIEELLGDRVADEGGDLWHRRIEELDAVACALSAHRYAVGHASWVGDPGQGVVVLPGAGVPETFRSSGVLPPVERLQLPPEGGE